MIKGAQTKGPKIVEVRNIEELLGHPAGQTIIKSEFGKELLYDGVDSYSTGREPYDREFIFFERHPAGSNRRVLRRTIPESYLKQPAAFAYGALSLGSIRKSTTRWRSVGDPGYTDWDEKTRCLVR